ncbi:MAG: DUF22 domain-containing protein [Methanobacterium sp.]|jgi:hypothetical protein|nr:DUF22 domain-containing protein [Methanobacterium sp.]
MSVRIIPRLDQVRKEIKEHQHSLDFNIGTISGDLRAIIAAEDKKYRSGDIKSIRIKHINIHANEICFLSAYASNKYGHTLAVGEETSLPISMDRSADTALFAAAMDCEIEEDDLLGVLILLPVKLTH